MPQRLCREREHEYQVSAIDVSEDSLGTSTTEPQRSLFVASSDANNQPAWVVDIVRWPDTVGDSGAAVCGSSGGGVKAGVHSARQFW